MGRGFFPLTPWGGRHSYRSSRSIHLQRWCSGKAEKHGRWPPVCHQNLFLSDSRLALTLTLYSASSVETDPRDHPRTHPSLSDWQKVTPETGNSRKFKDFTTKDFLEASHTTHNQGFWQFHLNAANYNERDNWGFLPGQ